MYSSNINKENTNNNIDTDLDIESLILNLKLISKIKQNEKLIIDNKIIKVDVRLLQNVRRWLTSDNRNESIEYIEYIINETLKYVKSNQINNKTTYSKDKIIEELSNTSNGLDNLKSTYKLDNIITAKIDILKEKIANMQ